MLDVNKFSNNRMSYARGIKKVVFSITLTGYLIMSGNVVSAGDLSTSQKAQVLAASIAQDTNITVIINGKTQFYAQPPVMQNGSVLVPMRGIFEALGAKISFDAKTQTVAATKGTTTVKLTLGKDIAYVNGKQVKLAVKAQSINGSTMVPLRFVGEALGATVNWNASTYTVLITSPKNQQQPPTSGQVVNGIRVKYGKHTYGVSNQAEYDKGMEIINAKIKSTDISNQDWYEYYKRYLDGERWDGNRNNRSELNRGLAAAEQNLGALVKAGVSKDIILKLATADHIGGKLTNMYDNGITDPHDGSPRSFYDTLVRKISDCDADAQTYSAVFDAMGFNTMIIAGPGHADMLVQVNGVWYRTTNGWFVPADLANSYNGQGYVYVEPTWGPAPTW